MKECPITRYPSERGVVCLWSDIEPILQEVEQFWIEYDRRGTRIEELTAEVERLGRREIKR